MKYLSVCSGIEAATVAAHPLGWQPFAFAENDKFPSALLAHHYSSVPNLGDMTRFKGWPNAALNVLVGGTPCQSFSIAGLRKGLADPRGNLMLTYLAVAERYWPEWVVWENVPGAFSVDGGRAFGALIRGLAELGYHAAWRVLDAQYVRVDGFGRAVPQRRRRVFVVGHLGDWRRAAAVLFERESLSWDSPPRREAGKRIAGATSCGPDGSSIYPTLDADEARKWGNNQWVNAGKALLVPSSGDVSHCLNAGGMGRLDYETETMIALTAKDHGGDAEVNLAPTLRAGGYAESHANAGVMPAIAFHENQRGELTANDTAGSLKVGGGKPGQGYPAIASGWAVRRLTPRECERLQGFPDDYTLIPYRGKPAADGPRYKALGNSMAVNVMRWLWRRIEHVSSISSSHQKDAAS